MMRFYQSACFEAGIFSPGEIMSYAGKLLQAIQDKLDGKRPTIFSREKLLERQFSLAQIVIAGQFIADPVQEG